MRFRCVVLSCCLTTAFGSHFANAHHAAGAVFTDEEIEIEGVVTELNFKNPHVNIIGHPTGRLVGKREGADINMAEMLKAAADHGVMMEINAHFKRLDLDDVHATAAKDLGIPIVISTDSHSVHGFDVLQYGVDQGRRAGLTKEDVANTKTCTQFKKLLKR